MLGHGPHHGHGDRGVAGEQLLQDALGHREQPGLLGRVRRGRIVAAEKEGRVGHGFAGAEDAEHRLLPGRRVAVDPYPARKNQKEVTRLVAAAEQMLALFIETRPARRLDGFQRIGLEMAEQPGFAQGNGVVALSHAHLPVAPGQPPEPGRVR